MPNASNTNPIPSLMRGWFVGPSTFIPRLAESQSDNHYAKCNSVDDKWLQTGAPEIAKKHRDDKGSDDRTYDHADHEREAQISRNSAFFLHVIKLFRRRGSNGRRR